MKGLRPSGVNPTYWLLRGGSPAARGGDNGGRSVAAAESGSDCWEAEALGGLIGSPPLDRSGRLL
ncbi:MAG: hypothetical protein LBB78_10510, partial [Spirochaetaceae bacterium]|nr:hypothetical protein [Spirochaetaceae bacterium]